MLQAYYSTQQSYEDENYQGSRNDYTGTTARRKVFNQARSQSMGQQISEDYDPDFPPPPRSNKPKLLPKIPVKIKPSPSLPPTPVKTQQRPATKRTSSLEYQEPQDDLNYYQETHNKQNEYNEDYNYAYQSTDNLIPMQPEVIQPANEYNKSTVNDYRNSGMHNQQQQQHNQQVYQEQTPYYYGEKPTVQIQKADDEQSLSRRDTIKKQFQGKRGRLESPRLYQQNTDSLESKDDDIRDSFETAMSSVSAQGLQQSFNSDFTPVPEQNIMTDKLDQYNNVAIQDKSYNSSSLMDNKIDRFNSISAHEKDMMNGSIQEPQDRFKSIAVIEKNERFNGSVVQDKNDRYNSNLLESKNDIYESNSHISESLERDRYNSGPGVIGPTVPERGSRNNSLQFRDPVLSQKTSPVATPNSTYPGQNHNQRFLQRQTESIDSYVEEEVMNDADYSRESPASVVDRYPQDSNTLIEPYRAITPKPSSPSPPKRQDTLDEEYGDSYEQSFDQQLDEYPIDEMPPAEKKLSFEEPQIVIGDQPKRKLTAKERWHWAYNKIIHQLNVSKLIITKTIYCTF